MAAQTVILDRPPLYVDNEPRKQFIVTLTGLLTGLGVFVLTWLLQHYFFSPAFCANGGGSSFVCGDDAGAAFMLSTVIGLLVATAVLARSLVYRPLLITVATAATLWGLTSYLPGMALGSFEQALWFMLLFGLGYTLYAWLLRFRHFAIALLLTLVGVVVLRFLLVIH